MAASRNSRSFIASRRASGHAYGTVTPIKCCYPYTPASPASMEHPLACPQPPEKMAQTQQPLSPSATPVTRSLPENPTSDLALALPSLEHLTKALYAHALASQQDCPPRRHHKSDRYSCVGWDRRLPSRDRERRTASCERRAPMQPRHEARHVSLQEPVAEPQPATAFETSSPRRKMHYVPAVPCIYPETKPRTSLPTPPCSLPSSSHPSPPPKPRHVHEPAPDCLPLSRDLAALDARLSKFRRFVLACRETAEDEDRINALIASYDQIMGNLVEEVVVMDSASVSD